VITDFVITVAFHYVPPATFAHSHLIGGVRAVSQTVTHQKMTSVLFFRRTCVPRVPNMINYIFSKYLELSNGKRLSNDSKK
jgi:hypothetical protein